MTAQPFLKDPEAGLSTRRLFKLLANTVWEWHWLSHLHKDKFKFLGCGDLLWVPHRFGSLGMIDAKSYPNVPNRRFNLFLHPTQLYKSRLFQVFKPRGITKRADKTYILFAKFIPYDIVTQFNIPHWEERFWKLIVSAYSRVDDRTRDAMASCRNAAATRNSLIVQVLRWREVISTYLKVISDGTQDPARANFEGADEAIAQLGTKLDHWQNIEQYRKAIRDAAADNELAAFIPICDEPPTPAPYQRQVDSISDGRLEIRAIHTLTEQLRQLLQTRKYDATKVGEAVSTVRARLLRGTPKVAAEVGRLERTFFARNRYDIAASLRHAIDSTLTHIGNECGLEWPPDLETYYRKLIRNDYPLPRRHFGRRN